MSRFQLNFYKILSIRFDVCSYLYIFKQNIKSFNFCEKTNKII